MTPQSLKAKQDCYFWSSERSSKRLLNVIDYFKFSHSEVDNISPTCDSVSYFKLFNKIKLDH